MWKIRLLVLLPAFIYSLNFISSSNGESYGYFVPDQFSFARRNDEIGNSEGVYPWSTDADSGYSVGPEPIPTTSPWVYLNSRYRMPMDQDQGYYVNRQREAPLSRRNSDEDVESNEGENENDDEDDEEDDETLDEENEDSVVDKDEDVDKDEEEDDDESVRTVKKKNETKPTPQIEEYSDYEKYPFVVNAILDELF